MSIAKAKTTRSPKPQEGPWEPSTEHQVTPTLVIACGGIPDEEVKEIQLNASRRLGFGLYPDEAEKLGFAIPEDVVRWERIKSSTQVTKEALERMITPFLQQVYLESLVSRKVMPHVPTKDKPLNIQIIILFEDATDGSARKILQVLESEMAQVETDAMLSLVLIAIGEPSVALGDETLYWPRFCLQKKTLGGMIATRERIVEVCQNLIVALVSSELMRAIDYTIRSGGKDRESVKWIWIGASALVSDIAAMYEYVKLSVLQKLTHPLLIDELTPGDQRWLDGWVLNQISTFQKANRTNALQCAEKTGWDTCPQRRPSRFANLRRRLHRLALRLQLDLELLREEEKDVNPLPLMMPGIDLKQMLSKPDPDLAKTLSDRYIDLRNVLEHNLFEIVKKKEYPHLAKELSARMRPREKGNHEEPVTPAQSTEPGGFATLIYAVAGVVTNLRKSPDLPSDVTSQGIPIHLAKSDYYLTSIATADAGAVHAAYWRFIRFRRTILSPLGSLLKLIPALPLLTALLVHFLGIDEMRSTVYAGLALLVLGVVEHFYFKDRVASFGRMLQEEQEILVARSALGNLARVLRYYRLMVIAHLQATAYTLVRLRDLLDRMREIWRKRLANLEGRFVAYDQAESVREQSAIYNLADLGSCKDWAKLAAERAQEPFRQVIVDEVFKRSRQSFNHVFNRMSSEAERNITKVFDDGAVKGLQVHALVGNKKLLGAGQHWHWLYQHAQPMGGARAEEFKEFTIVAVKNEAAFATREGGARPSDWLTARSLLNHEIGCFYGIVEL